MCLTKKKNKVIDPATKKKLENGYRKLQDARNCKSLLKKHLTEAVFDKLKKRETEYGSTLWDVIQSGVENLDSSIGVYAPDPDAYTVFADLFDPIIQEYHGGFRPTDNQPPLDFGDVNAIQNLDPDGDFVISTRVRVGRSLDLYPFNPCLDAEQYLEIEGNVSFVLKKLTGEHQGTYFPLTDMKRATKLQLTEDHFLFKEGDRFLQAAGACRFWPSGRGIFHNTDKTFLVWLNEEDHLRIISMQMGGDLGAVYRRLVTGVKAIGRHFDWSRSSHLGYLTFCPTNLGTTIRASVHVKLPRLGADLANVERIAAEYNLQVRGTAGEHSKVKDHVFDISNKRRLGLTEFEAVKEMQDGVIELIKLERSMH